MIAFCLRARDDGVPRAEVAKPKALSGNESGGWGCTFTSAMARKLDRHRPGFFSYVFVLSVHGGLPPTTLKPAQASPWSSVTHRGPK